MVKAETNKYAVPALDKGLDILEYLAGQELPRSQAEIASALERSPNEIYRVLVGLENRGYLQRDDISGKYRVSLKLYNLSRRINPVDKVRQCALPFMEDLAFSTGYSCYLSMLYQSQTMVIVHAASHGPISLTIAEGTLFPTMTSCPGKVLLANSNQEVRAMILERDDEYSKMSQVKRECLFKELEKVRELSHHTESSSFIEGCDAISALIGYPDGSVIAALTVSSLNSAMAETIDREQLLNMLLETAEKITVQLGS